MYTQTDLNKIALFGKLQLQVFLYPPNNFMQRYVCTWFHAQLEVHECTSSNFNEIIDKEQMVWEKNVTKSVC